MNPRAQRLIVQAARRYGVDPEVALRVASGEGGVGFGAVGDHGTSFGPYQLHVGGALPKGKGAGFANSAAGINYAVHGIAKYASGLHGQAGVSAAVRGFERPAAPDPEIARDMGYALGKIPSAVGSLGGGGVSPPQVSGQAQGGAGNFKQQAAAYFAQAAQAAAAGQAPDSSGLMGLAQARQQADATQALGAKAITTQVDHNEPLSPHAGTAVGLAEKYVGTKYLWGGTSPKTGFDCSGFVQWVYKQQGVNLPRTTYQQIKVGLPVNRQNLRPGDVVFFSQSGDVHHEGMYVGHNQFIHAPHTGDVVKISSLNDPYYASQFAGGRRMK